MCALLMVVSPRLHICFSPRLRDKVVWYKMEFLRCLILIHQDKLLRRLRIIGRPKQIANDLPKTKKYKWRKIGLIPCIVQGPWKNALIAKYGLKCRYMWYVSNWCKRLWSYHEKPGKIKTTPYSCCAKFPPLPAHGWINISYWVLGVLKKLMT